MKFLCRIEYNNAFHTIANPNIFFWTWISNICDILYGERVTPAPLGWYYTKADIFFLYKVQLYLTHFLFCFCGPDTLTDDKLNVDKYLFWINGWLTLQVVFFIPTLIWIIDVSFMNHNEGTFLQVLCKWQHIYCQYPRACHPLKAIEPTSLYWDILTAYLKMPGDHAVIFRKDVPIQGFTALWAHTWSGPGVRTCLLWVCYLHLTKLLQ